MRELHLSISSETRDGIETLWVCSGSTVISLSIEMETGKLSGFSCRLEPGVVAEMAEWKNTLTADVYPSLCVFVESEEHEASAPQYVRKLGAKWVIET